jgi:hypothetical protein
VGARAGKEDLHPRGEVIGVCNISLNRMSKCRQYGV